MPSDTPQVWGLPDVDDAPKLPGNFGCTTAAGVQVYSHTNYASKWVTGGFFFRNPNTRGGVLSLDGGETLLIGDASLDTRSARVIIGQGTPSRGASGAVLPHAQRRLWPPPGGDASNGREP